MTFSRRTATASLLAATVVGSVLVATLPAIAAGDDVVLTWTVTDSWSTGATVTGTVTNKSGTAVSPWAVSVSGGPTVSSVWDATLKGASTFQAPSWAPTLASGGSAQFGASVSSTAPPTSCTVVGHACRVVATGPTPTPTQTSTPTPTQTSTPTPTQTSDPGPGNLPTPVKFTPTSTASGTITYHTALPYPTGPNDKLTLSSNYTDLIISNYVGGAMLGRLIHEKNPNLAFDKDYVYGSLFAQLLQENINTTGYSNVGDWINPTASERAQLLAVGQGGPYQINDYSKRLETPAGIGLINFTALQKGLGYTVEAQDNGNQTASVGPGSLDQKYFGPMAAAYFHLNDYNRIVMNNADNWGPQYAYYSACMANLAKPESAQSPYNNFDMILNAAYNAGTYSAILKDVYRICAGEFGTGAEATQVKSIGDYSLSDAAYKQAIGTSESAGSTFILYPRQVRLYLDELYNKATHPSGAILGNTSINLSTTDIGYVFGNSMGTLAYVDGSGSYKYVAQADSSAAFSAALASLNLTSSSRLDISTAADRSAFFSLLDRAIGNLATRLNTDFGAVTQTTINGTTPTLTPTPTPTSTSGVTVKLVNVSDWASGRTMNAVVANTGTSAVSSWNVSFEWPQDISPWNGLRLSYTNGIVTVGNASWNGGITPGSSVDFGFGDGSASLPTPTACTAVINGAAAPCTIVR